MNTAELWRVIVGSHVWKMNHARSDTDYFTCYAVDTRSILRGEASGGGAHNSHTEVADEQRHEVQKWVDECLKGNFNYMVGVYSPLVVSDPEGYLAEFREICRRGRAKNVFHSIDGMVRHNLSLYHKKGIDGVEWDKKMRGCARSLEFGIRWMEGEEPRFEPVEDRSQTEVLDLLDKFMKAKEASKLPERPNNEEEYRAFLFKVRMARLDDV